jgi:MoxR-like ATPase
MASQTFKQVQESGISFTLDEIRQTIKAEVEGFPGRPTMWKRGDNPVVKMLALSGPHGIGKTFFVKSLASELQIPIRRMVFGEKEVEDNLGIPSSEQIPGSPGHHIMLAPPGFPMETPESETTSKFDLLPDRDISKSKYKGRGILLINEFCTANPKQESQLRSLISDRCLGDHYLGDGWIIIGDTNPLDQKYTTVNQLDESVQSRIFLMPVRSTYEEAMRFWQATGYVRNYVYKFLRINHPFWPALDNRRWTAISDSVECWMNNKLPESLIGRLMSIAANDTISAAFVKFIHHGDNPLYYPLTAKEYLLADEKAHKEHLALFDKWVGHQELQILMSVTTMDVGDWLHQAPLLHKFKNADERDLVLDRAVECMERVGAAQSTIIVEQTHNTLQDEIYEHIAGTKLETKMNELSNRDYKLRFAKAKEAKDKAASDKKSKK